MNREPWDEDAIIENRNEWFYELLRGLTLTHDTGMCKAADETLLGVFPTSILELVKSYARIGTGLAIALMYSEFNAQSITDGVYLKMQLGGALGNDHGHPPPEIIEYNLTPTIVFECSDHDDTDGYNISVLIAWRHITTGKFEQGATCMALLAPSNSYNTGLQASFRPGIEKCAERLQNEVLAEAAMYEEIAERQRDYLINWELRNEIIRDKHRKYVAQRRLEEKLEEKLARMQYMHNDAEESDAAESDAEEGDAEEGDVGEGDAEEDDAMEESVKNTTKVGL